MDVEGLLIKIGADAEEAKKAFEGIQKGLDEVSSKCEAAGKLMTAGITAPLVAIGAAGLKAGLDLDSAFDTIRTKTGQTGSALEGLQGSFRNVFKGVASSADDVGKAIADITARTGQVGPGLESLSTQFLNLSRITGESLGPAIEKGTRLFGDWGVEAKNQGSTMDMLFRTSQQTGVSFTNLASKLVEAGAPLRQLGFSLEQSAVMIGKFSKEGVNVELVLGGMRAALAKFGKAGLEPAEAFKDLVAQIKGADAAHANLISTTIVGAKRAGDFTAAIREGRLNLDELYDAVVKGGDSINKAAQDTADFAESWTIFKNKMTLALEPLGGALMRILNDLTPHLEKLAGWVANVADAFGDLSPGAQQAVVAFAAVAAGIGPAMWGIGKFVDQIPTVTKGFSALGLSADNLKGAFGTVSGLFSSLSGVISGFSWAGFMSGLSSVGAAIAAAAVPITIVVAALTALAAIGYVIYDNWNDIKATLSAIWTDLGNTVAGLRDAFMEAIGTPVVNAITDAWTSVSSFFGGVWEGIAAGVGSIKEWLVDTIGQAAVDRITGAWTAVVGHFSGIWDALVSGARAMASAFMSVWQGIKTAFGTLIDSMMHPVKTLVDGLLAAAKAIGATETIKALEGWKSRLDDAGKSVDQLASAAGRINGAFRDAGQPIEGAALSAKKLADETKKAGGAAAGAGTDFTNLGRHVKAAGDAMKDAFSKLGFKDLKKEAQDIENAFELLKSTGKLTALQLEDGANKVRKAWAAANDVTGEHAKLAKAMADEWSHVKTLLSGIPTTIEQMVKKLDEGFNFKGKVKDINDEIAKLEGEIANTGNASEKYLKGIVVKHLQEMKQKLGDIVAEQGLREVEKQFANLGTAVQLAGNEVKTWATRNQEGILAVTGVSLAEGAKIQQQARDINEAYKTLGVTFSGVFIEKAKEAQKALSLVTDAFVFGEATAVDFYRANIKALEAAIDAAKASGLPWDDLNLKLKTFKVELKEATGELGKVPAKAVEVRSATEEMSEAFKRLGSDMHGMWQGFESDITFAILKGQDFGKAFTNAARAIKEALVNYIVKEAFGAILNGLEGLTNSFTSLGKHISNILGGSRTNTNTNNTGKIGSIGVDSIGGGVTGVIGAVSGIVDAISSVIGNFQLARLEKTMNAVEENTRYSKGYLLQIYTQGQTWLPNLSNQKELQRLGTIESVLFSIEEAIRSFAEDIITAAIFQKIFDGLSDMGIQIGGGLDNVGDGLERVGEGLIDVGSRTFTAFDVFGRALGEAFAVRLDSVYGSLELFRNTTRQQLQFISEATMATYSAVNKPGFQAVFNPATQTPNTVLPGQNPQPLGYRPPVITNNNITVQQTTYNPYTMGQQIVQGMTAGLPAMR